MTNSFYRESDYTHLNLLQGQVSDGNTGVIIAIGEWKSKTISKSVAHNKLCIASSAFCEAFQRTGLVYEGNRKYQLAFGRKLVTLVRVFPAVFPSSMAPSSTDTAMASSSTTPPEAAGITASTNHLAPALAEETETLGVVNKLFEQDPNFVDNLNSEGFNAVVQFAKKETVKTEELFAANTAIREAQNATMKSAIEAQKATMQSQNASMISDTKAREAAAFGELRLLMLSPGFKKKKPPVVEANGNEADGSNTNFKRQRRQEASGFAPGHASFSLGTTTPPRAKSKKYFAKTFAPMQTD
ncbi:MAG: hypothetical protein SGARI_000815 [Bacillariaceae sp.]